MRTDLLNGRRTIRRVMTSLHRSQCGGTECGPRFAGGQRRFAVIKPMLYGDYAAAGHATKSIGTSP